MARYPYELYAVRLRDGRFVAARSTKNKRLQRLLAETGTPITDCRLVRQDPTTKMTDPCLYEVSEQFAPASGIVLRLEDKDGIYEMPTWYIDNVINSMWDHYLEWTQSLPNLAKLLVGA